MIRKLMAVAVLGLVLLWSAAPAAAQATRIDFTGIAWPTALLDPGTMTITPSGQIHGRGMVMSASGVYDVPELGAMEMILTANMNLSPPDMTGHVWGPASMVTADGSAGEGIWTGQRERVAEDHWISELHVVGMFVSGPLAGAEYRAVETIHSFDPIPVVWYEEAEGYLLIPGEN